MDSFGQNYGFWVHPSKHTTNSEYISLRREIEFLCKNVSQQLQKVNLSDAEFFYPILSEIPPIYMSVCARSKVVFFGLVDTKNEIVYNACESSVFQGFLHEDFMFFKDRCKNHIENMAKNNFIPLSPKLKRIWDLYLQNNKNLVSKVQKAQKDTHILLSNKSSDVQEIVYPKLFL